MKKHLRNIRNFILKNISIIIMFFCVIFFISMLESVMNNKIMQKDIVGYHVISNYLLSDTMTIIFKIITSLGSAIFLIGLTIALILLIRNKKIKISIVINLISITILNVLLKNIIQRPRPTEFRIIDESGYSFPSGHSMVSMAFYGFLIYLIYKYVKNKYLKSIIIVLLGILILFIGISRIYLGVHYTSDVIAGFLVSIVYLILYVKISNRFINKK